MKHLVTVPLCSISFLSFVGENDSTRRLFHVRNFSQSTDDIAEKLQHECLNGAMRGEGHDFQYILVGGLEHFLFFHILGIVTPTD
jgi:hypothetical protein